MSWDPEQDERSDKVDINKAIGKLLQSFDYEAIVTQPKGEVQSRRSHVKRPMNAFMVFAQGMRRRLSVQQPAPHNAELSKKLGSMWRTLSDEEKMPFIKEAAYLREQHKKKYPDYKYQPRRRGPKQIGASASKFKREPSLDSQIDFSQIDEGAILADGTPNPDQAELDQYLKPAPIPDYHELQSRYTPHHAHHQTIYTPLPTHLHPTCHDWQHYSGHP